MNAGQEPIPSLKEQLSLIRRQLNEEKVKRLKLELTLTEDNITLQDEIEALKKQIEERDETIECLKRC